MYLQFKMSEADTLRLTIFNMFFFKIVKKDLKCAQVNTQGDVVFRTWVYPIQKYNTAKKTRILFYILQEDSKSLVYRFFETQG